MRAEAPETQVIKSLKKLESTLPKSPELKLLKCAIQEWTEEVTSTISELTKLAQTDTLSGLSKRDVLIEKVTSELSDQKSGCLLLIDIDHFKQVNDTFGHPIGDSVIQGVSQVLKSFQNSKVLVSRIGGEEFGVWISADEAHRAKEIAERIRLQVAIGLQTEVPVTISIGFSTTGSTWEDYYQTADCALYQAKVRGRNRVCTAA